MKLREAKLSHDELVRIIDYDPETGVFRWKAPLSNRVKVGDIAGQIDHHGHRNINIIGTRYGAHRLAWFYVHKVWPKDEIDHKNQIADDNRLENLREATRTQNNYNRCRPKHNSTGFKGVTWHKAYPGRFMAQIRIENSYKYLGIFDTAEAAHAAYVAASQQYHGEYGRTE